MNSYAVIRKAFMKLSGRRIHYEERSWDKNQQ